MPCYQCRTDFSFFKREYSCKNCGFSFCASCLKKEIKVPKINQVAKVCDSCFKAIENTSDATSQSQRFTDDLIPENFKKRVAALDKKNVRPTPYKKKAPLNHQDSVEKRLENLRRDRLQNVPSVEVIEERLSKLRGYKSLDIPASSNNSIQSSSSQSKEQQAMNLLNQEWERNQIDTGAGANTTPSNVLLGKKEDSVDSIIAQAKQEANSDEKRKQQEEKDMKDIRNRLGKLQGIPDVANPSLHFKTGEMSEEEQIQRLIEKLSEEAKIESAMGSDYSEISSARKSSDSAKEEELPWCCICSEDASIRCYDCENDLFCRRCFKECHDGPDADHRTATFLKPGQKT